MPHNTILAGMILAGAIALETALGSGLELQTPITFEDDEYFLKPDGWIDGWDSGYELNGCIIIAHRRLHGSGHDYSDYYIKKDGADLEDKVYRGVFGTVDGDVIATDQNGDTVVFDSGWKVIESGLKLYYIRQLDGDRYFAVNDAQMTDYSWARGVDGGDIVEKYALYRLTEKLTDCKYDEIIPTAEGFDCVYTENGIKKHDLYRVNDKAEVLPRRELVTYKGNFYLEERTN